MPKNKEDINDVSKSSTETSLIDRFSVENYPNTLLEHITHLCDMFFVHEEFINMRAGTLGYSSIWLKEVAICATILHREIRFVVRNHNSSTNTKVIPFAGRQEIKECLLPFHLAMIKSAELAKNIVCLFECNHAALEVNDSNVRTYFDCMFALELILDQCNNYVDMMEKDEEDDNTSIYHSHDYSDEDNIDE